MRFEVNTQDVRETRWRDVEPIALDAGQARLRISDTAFTANNISYAVMGERFGYWKFFPVPEEGWGCIPVWGYADVIEDNDSGLNVGERIYGYFPMAAELVVTPTKVSKGRFVDGAPHRDGLPPVYNDYARVGADPSHDASKEPWRALFVPLAATAYGLADWMTQVDFMEADAVGCISASSKTALATAILLKARKGDRQIVGFTSARNLEAVNRIGVYDKVLSYDDVQSVDTDKRFVLIDFAGNANFSARLHAHLGENMLHNALVGASHPDAPRKAEGMNAERSELFFMPAYAQKRMAESDGKFLQDMMEAGRDVADNASEWMKLIRVESMSATSNLFARVLEGHLFPDEGGIIDFSRCAGSADD